MALNYDAEGFLVGDVVPDIRRARDILSKIREDVAAIKHGLLTSGGQNSGRHRSAPVVSVNSNARSTVEPAGRGSASEPPSLAREARLRSAATVEPRARGENGRFVGNGAINNSVATPNRNGGGQSEGVALSGVANKIAAAAQGTANGLEDVDPTVRAFKEVAEPLSRGYSLLFSGDKDKNNTKWFRRIFGELRLFRRDESVFNRAANRSLHNLENTQGDNENGGGQSFLGGLLGSISPWIMTALATIGTTLLTGVTTVLGVIFSPIGLAVGLAATAAWGLFTENGQKFFANIGSKLVDGWFATLDYLKPVFDSIGKKWDEGVKVFTDLWEPIGKFFKDKFGIVTETVSKAATGVNNFIKDKTGIDVIGSAKAIPKKLQDRWQDAKQYLGNAAQKAGIDPGILAKIANFESGFNSEATPTRKDGSKMSSAHGFGQFLDSTWRQMLAKFGSKYGLDTANLSKEQAARLRSNKELQAAMMAEFTKENIKRGREIGGSNDDANVYALHNLGSGDGAKFLKALRQNPSTKVSDILGKGVISGNKSLYGDGSITLAEAYARMGNAMSRGDAFAQDIRMPFTNKNVMTQSATLPMPKVPSMPKPQSVAEMPPIITPLGTGGDARKSLSVKIDKGLVGQDLSERKIALLVTGGLSGRS